MQADRPAFVIAQRIPQAQALDEQVLCGFQVTLTVGKVAGGGESACSNIRRAGRLRQCQQLRQASAPLGIVAAHVPEVSQYYGHPQARFGITFLDRPEERCPQVVVFLNRVSRVPRVVHAWRLHIRRQLETPRQMPIADRRAFTCFFESLQRVLTDRLQKAKTGLLRPGSSKTTSDLSRSCSSNSST